MKFYEISLTLVRGNPLNRICLDRELKMYNACLRLATMSSLV